MINNNIKRALRIIIKWLLLSAVGYIYSDFVTKTIMGGINPNISLIYAWGTYLILIVLVTFHIDK